jgi:hypothetical protein
MSAEVLPAQLGQAAVEPFWLWEMFTAIRRRVAGLLMSERERKLLDLILPTLESVGAHLLAAEDVSDLDDRIDIAIERPDLHRVNAAILGDADLLQVVETANAEGQGLEPLTELLGGAVAPHFRRIAELGPAIVAGVVRYVRAHPEVFQAAATRDDPLAFLSNPLIPPDVQQAMLHAVRADQCFAALLHLLASKHGAPPWLQLALAERASTGYYEYLRLLASDPDFGIPEKIVPAADRLDLSALNFQAAMTDVWVQEAAAGTGDRTFPFADDDDDS